MGAVPAAAAGRVPALSELALECAAIGQWMLGEASLNDRLAGSVPFLTMSAVAVAGWQLLLQAREVGGIDGGTKTTVADYFSAAIVLEALGSPRRHAREAAGSAPCPPN